MIKNKQTVILIGLVIITIGSAFGMKSLVEKLNQTSSAAITSQKNYNNVVDVEGFAKNPYSYLGKEIQLKGVVSFVYPESQMIVLIDNKEYASCGVVTCAINQIPVAYSGSMPNVKDFVIATGKVSQSNDGKLLIKATEVKSQ